MTTSKLFTPPPPLSSCIFAAIYRDTRGANLRKQDRINHFPASPLVSLSVIRHGQLSLLSGVGDDIANGAMSPLEGISILGPSDAPVSSWSPGEVEAITVGMFPDAWLQLGGSPDFAAPPASLLNAANALAASATAEEGWSVFCTELTSVWNDRRDGSWRPATDLSDWARSLMSRAALSGRGQSVQSFERRLKRLSGQSKRTLDFYTSFENLHKISTATPDGAAADIAAVAGFSDQSHMGRSVRRATGFSPKTLNRAIRTEEAFWCYRLLGERY